jgi:hypothetical protein
MKKQFKQLGTTLIAALVIFATSCEKEHEDDHKQDNIEPDQ